ncbi:GTP binding translation elongation factor [Indivirus ILV1]|uniref:GTP binding translation elongation factor n=1 Tax=Indivirus ILV1 TaxID=1977633 RepID=A0A1V0SDL5_9VIRU|nr:GTP binding translation elongation factor [Indivirus ILV1]
MKQLNDESNLVQNIQKEVCLVVAGSVDSGKCHKKGTKVIKYNGQLELVENLKIGDLLMGDDSSPRKILEIHSGTEQLYKIFPINEQYSITSVTGEHILCLKYLNHECITYEQNNDKIIVNYAILENGLPISKIESFPLNGDTIENKERESRQFLINMKNKKLNHDDIVEISVNNFMKLPKNDRDMLKWYRTSVEFTPKNIPFDAYIFGAWLGNNISSNNEIINIDSELLYYLQTYNLLHNIHIPDIYKYNSRETRLQLLAGLIDSDGNYSKIKNLYSFTMIDNNLMNDVKYLIRSLGFSIYEYGISCREIKPTNNGSIITTYYKFEFGGNEQESIPCKLLNKQAQPTKINNNGTTSIIIEKDTVDDYYGFSLDGNKRFLLEDFSVSHNSSFIGVMMNGILDDGRGLARSVVARHPHEVTEGKTSDISTRTMEFNGKNVTLVDLCGHEKYLKTTLFGITGLFPDYGILIVSANRGLLKMTKEHLGIFLYLKIPFIILITRVDITPPNIYEMVIDNITKILKKYKKKPKFLNTIDELKSINDPDKIANKEKDTITIIDKITMELKVNPYLTPVLSVSNKTGYYMDSAKYLLSKLESRQSWHNELGEGSIFYIDSKFTPTGIGLVVSGIVRGDKIFVGSEMLLGPFNTGEFKRIRVWSVHNNNKEVVHYIDDRSRGCLAIKSLDKKDEINPALIRKGLVIISKNVKQKVCYQFTADVEILNHSSVISPHYTPVIHCGPIRQTARINFQSSPEDPALKLGDRKEVSFRFFSHPEFVEEGMTFFFREGTTRGVGIVKSILLIKDDPSPFPISHNAIRRKKHKKRQIRII